MTQVWMFGLLGFYFTSWPMEQLHFRPSLLRRLKESSDRSLSVLTKAYPMS